MYQHHACGPNRDKLPLIDMAPEGVPNMPRRRLGEPPLPPQHLVGLSGRRQSHRGHSEERYSLADRLDGSLL
jgi:hypothetical protein